MNSFVFTVDDNVRFLKELCSSRYKSIFEHPYLAMYKRFRDLFGLKVQLNLFYEMPGFNLSMMTDRYKEEWRSASNWLKLSFHSRLENVKPYEHSGYDELRADVERVHSEIIRFAGEDSLAATTTVHYCRTTEEGTRALYDSGVRGLLGLYGTEREQRISYSLPSEIADRVRRGELIEKNGITHASIDVIVNLFDTERAVERIRSFMPRDCIRLMIHEQYFYPDYHAYQSDFEYKLYMSFSLLCEKGYESRFFEELL